MKRKKTDRQMVQERGQRQKKTQKNNIQLDESRGLDVESKGEYKTKDEYISVRK